MIMTLGTTVTNGIIAEQETQLMSTGLGRPTARARGLVTLTAHLIRFFERIRDLLGDPPFCPPFLLNFPKFGKTMI